jgi:putative ABC transport system ATP-binding protein
MESVIKFEGVNFYYNYGKTNETHALKNISFEIYPGEFIAIFGPSGCGKSTLLYLISGIEKAQKGNIEVLNKNYSSASLEELAVFRQIAFGLIFQSFNLLPSLKVIDNVMLPMAFIGISPEKRRERALYLLERLGIKNLAERYPHELSGGQQQRVGIARSLANDPPIILADEPIGNLDSKNAKIVLELLKEINQKDGKTIVMVTHQAWSLYVVDRIFYLKDGELVKIETKEKEEEKEVVKVGSSYYWKELFPRLPRVQVFAKVVAHHILRNRTEYEIKRLEELILKFVKKEINAEEFFKYLDLPFVQGGIGLSKKKANQLVYIIEDLIQKRKALSKILKELETQDFETTEDELEKVKDWLFEGYEVYLSPIQKIRFFEVLYERIKNIITQESFVKILDLPIDKGGVGLRTDLALKIGDKFNNYLSSGALI